MKWHGGMHFCEYTTSHDSFGSVAAFYRSDDANSDEVIAELYQSGSLDLTLIVLAQLWVVISSPVNVHSEERLTMKQHWVCDFGINTETLLQYG